jgi:alkaline phosphatase D
MIFTINLVTNKFASRIFANFQYMNMKTSNIFLWISAVAFSCNKTDRQEVAVQPEITTIAFGSCGHQNNPQPVLERVADLHPDFFIYLGDNIYSDTYSMDTLQMNYNILGAKPEFQKLKAATKIFATWDDHDFGLNDAGRHYPHKEESKKIFLNFFGIPDSSMLNHPGIYYSKILAGHTRSIQLIMLDMRTFRDKLLSYNGNRDGDARFQYEMDYSPYATGDSTMLGKEQWQWLEQQLEIPADIRIIGSSTQFGITHNGYEAWANFPHEQKKMLELIRKKKVDGVLFISGDVHYAELSKITEPGLYPIYDLTASGITSTWDFATPNDNRIEGPVMENHFGLIKIDWSKPDPEIALQIFDVDNKQRISKTITLSEISFQK